ncbi:dihydroorotate dehydrogenase [Hymenobacter rubidus]|uniref:hypothetical protein n=1 Tax=Hymenobacter rubidus TaxID=1441626 RepID=UPI00191FCBDE|nr:hypothetical protein [Hymenobacter rubidus]
MRSAPTTWCSTTCAGHSGLVATNTTISRDKLSTAPGYVASLGAGGLSGKPLRARATEVIRYLHRHSDGGLPIIGAGGIHSVADAQEKLAAGATLIQLCPGFVYEGPALVGRINRSLARG